MGEKSGNPYDMDGPSFDADRYLQKLLKECSLKQIMDTEAAIVRQTQTLHSDMQTLVYENYNKFISATDTIRKMKTDFKSMETEMNLLMTNMQSITDFSERITDTLQETRSQLTRLSGKHQLLKKLQFLSSLPAKLKTLIEEENYQQAVQEYSHAQKVLQQYGQQPSFQGIQEDCIKILDELKDRLRGEFRQTGKSAQSLTEIGELLLQLGERPSSLAKEMLECASKRLHEQIVVLQDQTDRDMIEFIDLGIEGFLKDLTLVISSYNDMFLARHLDQEADNFEQVARLDLNEFVNRNVDEYLALVQDRAELEIGHGDSQIILRGLDRLHRRMTAMRTLCKAVDMSKSGLDIIVSAAQQLCQAHMKSLKDHFADSLSSIRLALVSSNTASASNSGSASSTQSTSVGAGGGQVNPPAAGTGTGGLRELISNLYVSTIEKVKGLMQDLLIFLQPEWSFNLKSDPKGIQCIEGIRENLLVAFLRHFCCTVNGYGSISSTAPPTLLLVLSKVCLEMERAGVHTLTALVDELYSIDSERSVTLVHESELCAEMRDSAQLLLDSYVRLQALNLSQMLRKSVETRDWLNCLEPRSVRAVMKRVVEEISAIDLVLGELYDGSSHAHGTGSRTTASSDSSRKTHFSSIGTSKQSQFRSTWSTYTPQSQMDSSFVSNMQRLFSEKIEIFAPVEFSKVSIITGIIKICLKTLLECVRLRTFSRYGLQQIQVDAHYLQMNLWRFVSDENLIHVLLDEILGSAVLRCLEPILMEPNAVEIICERN
ncbi:vacuolar protein sorting-associated protein 51 homolog isoform X1 [Anopheles ziemanni]|uniref:vacuolar protein sorting-associated protein 51 homolog isoform X1 n=1 Tax=Anopheles coustani TaxID=139045 RepID=UPI002658B463|nr:vacuolar protein sorting-associated protein 51 homolog isoform X1 [Anopheles coustani]XP_058171456.1 vacuolar protein sorting-associated protein 51 homolog isoform X1 [Anopheles ziemanni]